LASKNDGLTDIFCFLLDRVKGGEYGASLLFEFSLSRKIERRRSTLLFVTTVVEGTVFGNDNRAAGGPSLTPGAWDDRRFSAIRFCTDLIAAADASLFSLLELLARGMMQNTKEIGLMMG
jgi:hypothetical protein